MPPIPTLNRPTGFVRHDDMHHDIWKERRLKKTLTWATHCAPRRATRQTRRSRMAAASCPGVGHRGACGGVHPSPEQAHLATPPPRRDPVREVVGMGGSSGGWIPPHPSDLPPSPKQLLLPDGGGGGGGQLPPKKIGQSHSPQRNQGGHRGTRRRGPTSPPPRGGGRTP